MTTATRRTRTKQRRHVGWWLHSCRDVYNEHINEHWSRSKLQSGSHFTSGIPSKVFTPNRPNLHPCFAILGYVWFMNVCEYEIVHVWEIVGGSKMPFSWYCASLNICLTVTVTIIEAELLLLPVVQPTFVTFWC